MIRTCVIELHTIGYLYIYQVQLGASKNLVLQSWTFRFLVVNLRRVVRGHSVYPIGEVNFLKSHVLLGDEAGLARPSG
jgi:hypothetical protein